MKVVAVQTGVIADRWIRATRWHIVARLLHDAVPETRAEILSVYSA